MHAPGGWVEWAPGRGCTRFSGREIRSANAAVPCSPSLRASCTVLLSITPCVRQSFIEAFLEDHYFKRWDTRLAREYPVAGGHAADHFRQVACELSGVRKGRESSAFIPTGKGYCPGLTMSAAAMHRAREALHQGAPREVEDRACMAGWRRRRPAGGRPPAHLVSVPCARPAAH